MVARVAIKTGLIGAIVAPVEDISGMLPQWDHPFNMFWVYGAVYEKARVVSVVVEGGKQRLTLARLDTGRMFEGALLEWVRVVSR